MAAAKSKQQPQAEAQPFIEHLRELRTRMIRGLLIIFAMFLVCFAFKEHIFHFLTLPLSNSQYAPPHMIFTGLHELFFTYMKISFLGGLFIGLPFLLWQLWLFVAPALYAHEKRVVLPLLIISPILFYAGGAFMYFLVMPIAIDFFLGFGSGEVTALPAVKEYLSFLIKMVFGFGLAFELPVVLLLFIRIGILKVEQLISFRRYAIVILLIIATLITPPDPISQLLLAVPMMVLYEVAIFAARWIQPIDKKTAKRARKSA